MRDSYFDPPHKREDAFVIERPKVEHIHAPKCYNMNHHEMTVEHRDAGWYTTLANDAGDNVGMLHTSTTGDYLADYML